MNPIRISKPNVKIIEEIAFASKNEFLTVPKIVNKALEKGLPAVRKKFVKTPKRMRNPEDLKGAY